jgi:hypothetical protein
VTETDLQRVQRRRELPMRIIQRVQVLIQNKVISRALQAQETLKPPLLVKMLNRWPRLRRLPARLVGIGFRPEHVHTPDAYANSKTP